MSSKPAHRGTAHGSADRRVLRTRRLLHEALIALIHERGWDAIGVQDICERADVGRSTFYVHFADKEELLLGGFDQFRKQLRAQVAGTGKQPLAFVRPLVEHVHDHQRLFRALVGKKSGQAAQKRLLEVICELLDHDVARVLGPGPRRAAVIRYAANAFLGTLIWWLDSRTGLSVDDIDAILTQLTTAVLSAVERQGRP